MRKTVLVVEDSDSSRDLTVHVLQQSGYRVLEAADGEEALHVLEREHADLILTDIMMPKMDGWALAKHIRKQARFALTPIIFLTVLDDIDNQVRGFADAAVDDYLTKPITAQQLVARVQTTLARAERIRRFLRREPATGLALPDYFQERLQEEAQRAEAFGRNLALVVFVIQNYLAIERGQADWFARRAAEEAGIRIQRTARPYDLVADMQWGRFAALLPERSADEARAWAQDIQQGWDLRMLWEETQQKVSVEIAFSVDAIAPGTDALALLAERLDAFERKW